MKQTIEQALKNGNDGKNQTIKGKFIDREVYCNVNTMVEFILSHESNDSPFGYEDIENLYTYPEYYGNHANFGGGTEEEKDNEIERLKEIWENESAKVLGDWNDQSFLDATKMLQDDINTLEELETQPAEIFEWWAISSYLHDKLKERGECVLDAGSCHVWGRQTSGQAILLDGVITRICAEMEILEGQANDWSKD